MATETVPTTTPALRRIIDQLRRARRSCGGCPVRWELRQVGRLAESNVSALCDGEWRDVSVDVDLDDEDAVRREMAHPARGAWFSAEVSVDGSGEVRSVFEYEARPEMAAPLTAEDVADELAAFPRNPEWVPEWCLALTERQ